MASASSSTWRGGEDGVVDVRSGLRLRDVVGHVREVAHLDRRADDVHAHRDDVLRRRAVVARAHVALERGVERSGLEGHRGTGSGPMGIARYSPPLSRFPHKEYLSEYGVRLVLVGRT